MFESIAMIFTTITNFFSAINRLTLAGDHLAETAEQRASAFRDEQSEENKLRLAELKARAKHNADNPKEFEF